MKLRGYCTNSVRRNSTKFIRNCVSVLFINFNLFNQIPQVGHFMTSWSGYYYNYLTWWLAKHSSWTLCPHSKSATFKTSPSISTMQIGHSLSSFAGSSNFGTTGADASCLSSSLGISILSYSIIPLAKFAYYLSKVKGISINLFNLCYKLPSIPSVGFCLI